MKTLAKWTVNEYHSLVKNGFLDHKNVELLNGELIEMSPESPLHCVTTEGGKDYLRHILGSRAIIRESHPITLKNSEPEPDLAIVKSPRTRYSDRHPSAEDIFWLIEVSNSTLAYDLSEKKAVYEQEGIEEYWVIDIPHKRLHVFKDLVDGKYHSLIIHTSGIISPQAFSDVEVEIEKLFA